jgi:uncharacterized protein
MSNVETIHFMSDGDRLTGTLHLPDTHRPPLVIGCHGLLADRHSPKQIALAEALGRIQIAYFRFDHRGCGDSQGRMEATDLLPSRCRELYHAMRTMQTFSTLGDIIGLFGSSFGGTVVMATAAEHPVARMVTYAAPINSRTIERAAARKVHHQQPTSLAPLEQLSFDIGDRLGHLHDILIVHGQADEIVPPSHARHIFACAADPKQLVIQPGGDHRMSAPHHQHDFLRASVAWFRSAD